MGPICDAQEQLSFKADLGMGVFNNQRHLIWTQKTGFAYKDTKCMISFKILCVFMKICSTNAPVAFAGLGCC